MKTGVVVLTFLVLLVLAAVLNRAIIEAQTGNPSIQTTHYISDSDQRVYVNDTFTVRFSMRRTSGGAGNGGISVSFPGLDQADINSSASAYDSAKGSVVTDSYTNGSSKVSYFASGYSPIHRADGTQRTAEYLLVETDDTSWPLNTYRTLELEVTPKTTGLLVINYRYWLCGDGYQNCTYSPDSGSVDRQQGWNVDSFRVLVRNREPAARRVTPSSRDVELEPGDWQTFTARGTDRDGNLAHVDWYLDDDEWSGGLSLVPTDSYTSSNPFHFPDAGTYEVRVTFTDTVGESASIYWDVEVSDDIRIAVASDPTGRTVTVDGNNRTTPYATTWDSGSRLTLDVPSPQNVSGVSNRYVFSHWSHGGSQRQTVRPTTDTTYTANFDLQHFVSTRTEPRGVGIAGGGWYDHGSTARIGPAPTLTGLQFSHWQKGHGETIGSDPAGVLVTVNAAFLVEAVYTDASAPAPQIDSLGCAPTTVQVGETVSCRPALSGGIPTEYDWDAIGGSPFSSTARNFSTRWNTPGTKRIDLEVCNDSGCDDESETIVVGSGGGACFTDLGTLPTGNTSVSGSWDGSCASIHRSGRYGRFYAFTLNQRSLVQIDLASSVDTYLYLLSGADSRGAILYENDDGGTSSNDSHLELTLESGTYTIEATTFHSDVAGNFSLDIHTSAPPSEDCVSDLGTLSTRSTHLRGSWTGECASIHRGGSHARFYTFTLANRTRAWIFLSSTVDTYVYLLNGAGVEGAIVDQDDNSASGSDARLSVTLAAGTYTVEATTADRRATGSFSLEISIDAPPSPPDVPLGDPTNLRASPADPRQVMLNWLPAPGAEEHWIWSVKADGTGGKWTTVSGSANNATITGLQTGQNYWFIIIAGRNVNGVQEWSQWSQWVSVQVPGTAVPAVSTDRAALVALYNATGGANWRNNRNWLSAAPLDQWHGVKTDAAGRVIELRMSDNRLAGLIPAEFFNLSNLTGLFLGENQLTGPIPGELGRLSNLTRVTLSSNRLSGPIPQELGNLSNLTGLSFAGNRLSGAIPREFGNFSNLNYLYLSGNFLSGAIPRELGNLSNLGYLALNGNQLSGVIPRELGNLSNLANLTLANNRLTGMIPQEFSNLSNLRHLLLAGNQLTGCIPTGLQNVRSNDFDELGLPLCGTAQNGDGSVVVQQPSDLVVNLTISDGGLLYSGTVATASATVFNEGNGTSATTTLRDYRSQDRRFTADNEIHSWRVGSLAPSSDRETNPEFIVASDEGDYAFAACVDEVFLESDTANNCSECTSATVLHPLTLTSYGCTTGYILGVVPDATEISGPVLARRAVNQANEIWSVIDAFGNTDSSGVENLGSMAAGETKDLAISTSWSGLNNTCDLTMEWEY